MSIIYRYITCLYVCPVNFIVCVWVGEGALNWWGCGECVYGWGGGGHVPPGG